MAKSFDYKSLTGETDTPVIEKEEKNEKKEKKPLPFVGLGAKIKTVLPAGKNGRRKKPGEGKATRKQKMVRVGVIMVLLIAVVATVPKVVGGFKKVSAGAAVQRAATMGRRSITSDLPSSGTTSPRNTCNVTVLASGETITADFEEGDQVKKRQAPYIIDTSSIESELKSAQNSLKKAQTSYDLAVEDYNEVVNDYSGNTYKSTETGFIKTLYIKTGDKVSSNTRTADVCNDKVMKIRAPFLSGEAAVIGAESQGAVTLTGIGEQLLGTITSVSNMGEALIGERLVQYVALEVENPSGLTSAHTATVIIGDFSCALEGTFEASVNTVMSTDLSSSVGAKSMIVMEGNLINKGTAIFRMSNESANSLVRNYKDAMGKAQESPGPVQSKVDSIQDSYENYTATTPISDTVITKSVKAGDKIGGGGNSGTMTLATIYDLPQVTSKMPTDELDIQSVQVGQSMVVTAGVFENQTFGGRVTNISLVGSSSNGATNYPMMVTLDEVGGLLPDMNVNGRIILEEAKNTLVVPVDLLMRGNKVYIKDNTVKETNGAVPAGSRLVEVETGLISDDLAETISGLSEGDVVCVVKSSASPSLFTEMMTPGGGGNMGGTPGGGGDRGGRGGDPGGDGPQTGHQGGET